MNSFWLLNLVLDQNIQIEKDFILYDFILVDYCKYLLFISTLHVSALKPRGAERFYHWFVFWFFGYKRTFDIQTV